MSAGTGQVLVGCHTLCKELYTATSERPLEGKCDGQAHFTDEYSKGRWHEVTEKVAELGSG